MKIPGAAVFVLLLAIKFGWAAVGETEEQLKARYEKSYGDIPTEAFGPMRAFMFGKYIVGVALANGISDMEMFSKSDESDMSASEIDALLKANGEGQWKAESTGKPNWRRWRRDDESLVALYDTKRHFLYINSRKFYEQQGKKMEEPALATPNPAEKLFRP